MLHASAVPPHTSFLPAQLCGPVLTPVAWGQSCAQAQVALQCALDHDSYLSHSVSVRVEVHQRSSWSIYRCAWGLMTLGMGAQMQPTVRVFLVQRAQDSLCWRAPKMACSHNMCRQTPHCILQPATTKARLSGHVLECVLVPHDSISTASQRCVAHSSFSSPVLHHKSPRPDPVLCKLLVWACRDLRPLKVQSYFPSGSALCNWCAGS